MPRTLRSVRAALVVRVVATAVVLVTTASVTVPAPASADDPGPVRYVAPVDAPVIDPFRAPASPYGPGNRGLDYDTAPGDEVRAAAPGTVVFAGQVGGELHVTVAHDDGRRSSYSFLAEVAVAVGRRVGGGERIGVAGERLHVGLREGETYVDPAAFFGTEVRAVRLVPENPAGGALHQRVESEVSALLETTLREGPSTWDRLAGLAGGVGGFLWDRATVVAPALFDVALFVARELAFAANPVVAVAVCDVAVPLLLGRPSAVWDALQEAGIHVVVPRVVGRFRDWWDQRGRCTSPEVDPPRPTERRIAVLVGGLGSTSSDAAVAGVPVGELGYADGDVVGFSYAGGRTPDLFGRGHDEVSPDLAVLAARAYGEAHSTSGLAERGALLADLLEDVAGASPGTPVDLYGHSQGGVVLRLALADLAGRPGGDEVLASLGLVATMATPHQGSDLATAALVAAGTGEGQVLLGGAAQVLDAPVDPDTATNLADLARGSELLGSLAEHGLPSGPSYLSLSARGDLLVADGRTELDGARQVTLPVDGFDSHEALPAAPETARELALGLAGMDPTCESLVDVVADLFATEGTHLLHAEVGALVAVGASFSELPEGVGTLVGD